MCIVTKLVELQGDKTDKAFAEELGIHRVSWQKIKHGKLQVSDKFLVRAHRAFPELDIFLPKDDTESNISATSGINTDRPEKPQNGRERGLVAKVRGLLRVNKSGSKKGERNETRS